MNIQNLSAIILAGGESSRMGEDKALLTVEGVPLLQRTCTLAKQVTPNLYVVTFWPERYISIVPKNCQLIEEQRLPNSKGSHGPLIGFAQALSYIQSEWVLLLACDLPKLTLEVLVQGAQSKPSNMSYLPRTGDRWEPLCGFYHFSCFRSLQDYIEGGGRSFQAWLNSIPVQEWVISDRSILFNCNTPEDFQQLTLDRPVGNDPLTFPSND